MEDFNKVTLNIPELMEDELLYSFIIRMAKENAMECKDFVRIYIDNLTPEKRKKNADESFLDYKYSVRIKYCFHFRG